MDGGTVERAGLAHVRELEAEAVHILREVVAELERPVLLYGGGKDSIVLLRLAEKAFAVGGAVSLPFPVLHVDTGHNFDEVIAFRDRRIAAGGHALIVASVQAAIDAGRLRPPDPTASRQELQTHMLLDALTAHRFDAALGGGRRDEERARAKERVLSLRDALGRWEPRAQRAEPWTLYNGRIRPGEHIRAFPISNWTELDVWSYVALERLELPSLYFAHDREVVRRGGRLLAVSRLVTPRPGEEPETLRVRFRAVGDVTVTGAMPSTAGDVADVIAELAAAELLDARDEAGEAATEDRRREGYF